MPRLKGRAALITGGSRGIGAAVADRFAREGADVVITYARSPHRAEQVVSGARERGVQAEAIRADAADSAAVQEAVRHAARTLGRLDILVNNAGLYATGSLEQTTEEAFDQAINVNVRAVFVAAREAARVLADGGRIINIGSVFGQRVPFPGIGLYSMSKFAVAGFTRAWARDLAPRGITVNVIQPGPIDTEMNPADGDHAPAMKQITALGRYGRAEEIARVAAFLASHESTYITGAVLNVDGGFEA